jgi:hypothetical protein
MLLCLSSGLVERFRGFGVGFEESVDLAGDRSYKAAFDVAAGLALGGSAGGVGLGFWVVLQPAQRDGVPRSVELPVAAAVESMPHGLSTAGVDGCRSAEGGEGCFVADAPTVGPGDQQLRGGDCADAGLVEQLGAGGGDELLELGLVFGGLGLQEQGATGDGTDRARNATRSTGIGSCGAGRYASTSRSAVSLAAASDDPRASTSEVPSAAQTARTTRGSNKGCGDVRSRTRPLDF